MYKVNKKAQSSLETRNKLLDAAMGVIRTKGYNATSVDDICQMAGVTKGSFFHHFQSKEALAVAAAAHFSAMADTLFSNAPFREVEDPLAQLLGYIDFRIAMFQGGIAQYTCLLGTMVQETYATHPAIRDACDQYISAHAEWVAQTIEAAKARYAPQADWRAESLGFFTQAALQGAFILSKAKPTPEIAVESLQHLRRYIEMLFRPSIQP
jgi:TetR/AcrR family transcriptional repressor of nem operon